MNPERYRELYLEPFAGDYEVSGVPAAESLFYLPERCYYSEQPMRLPLNIYGLTLDKLTRAELVALVAEAGLGDPRRTTPESIVNKVREGDRTNETRRVLLIDREAELASLREDIDRMVNARSYRVYRMLLVPLRAARTLWRKVVPGERKQR